jgi:hypothetical protein
VSRWPKSRSCCHRHRTLANLESNSSSERGVQITSQVVPKISRLTDSCELTTGYMVEACLARGLTTAPGGARCRILRRGGIPNGLGRLNSATPSGSVTSGQKRFFAIVSPPIPTSVAGKTIRRIMIFDNHPDSLRLVLKSGLDLEGDAAASRRERRRSIICGFILIAMVVAALLWPLWW